MCIHILLNKIKLTRVGCYKKAHKELTETYEERLENLQMRMHGHAHLAFATCPFDVKRVYVSRFSEMIRQMKYSNALSCWESNHKFSLQEKVNGLVNQSKCDSI